MVNVVALYRLVMSGLYHGNEWGKSWEHGHGHCCHQGYKTLNYLFPFHFSELNRSGSYYGNGYDYKWVILW